MKKTKKWMSLLLASALALSVTTVGFTAFAAGDAAVTKMEESIAAAGGWSDELGNEWKALTEEQKDAVQPQRVAKIHSFAWTKVGGKMDKVHEKKAGELLGGYTVKTQAAMTLAEKMIGLGKHTFLINGVETEIDLKNGGWNNNRWNYVNDYTYKDKSSGTEITITIPVAQQKAVYKALKAEFDAATPHQQALTDFMNAQSAYTLFNVNSRLSITHQFMVNYIKQIPALMGAYTPEQFETYFMANFGLCEDPIWNVKEAIQFHLDWRDSTYLPYMAIENPTVAQDDAYVAAYDKYNRKAGDTASILWSASATYAAAFAHNGGLIGLGTISSSFNAAYNAIIGRRQGYAFNEKLETINVPAKGSPEFNKTIYPLQAEYKKFNGYVKEVVSPKYFDIVGKWYNDGSFTAQKNTHVLPEQAVVESEAPTFINSILQDSLESVINLAAGGLDGMIHGIFTNDLMSASFLSTIDTALGSQMAALKFSPDKLASYLNADETQFAKAKAELTGKTDWAEVGSLDWGVIPGDYETFSKALCAALRGVLDNSVLNTGWIKKVFLDTYTLNADGSVATKGYTFGLYGSVIIPVMEMCGVTDMISSYEYTQQMMSIKADNGHNDGYLKVMLDEIYYKLLSKVFENPAKFILQSLPNLVYHLEDGCIFKDVESSIHNAMGLLADPIMGLINPYMGLDKIWNLLTQPGTTPDGAVKPPMLDLAALGINLTLEDITNIAHLGKAEIVDTECKKYESRVNITADEQSVKNYLVNLMMGITSDLGVSFTTDAVFVKQEAPKYPHDGKMGKKVMNTMIKGLDGLLGGVVNLNDTINGLFTQELAANAITGIYGALEGVLSGLGVAVTPKNVADFMTEEKYDSVRYDLQHDAWADVGLVLKNDAGVVYQTDMGFKSGDRQGFLDCVVAALRPASQTLGQGGILTNTTAEDGSTVYGLYETLIIPLFEAIGLTPAATSDTYTKNYNQLAKKESQNKANDYLMQTIVAPVASLLDDFAATPADTLMRLLPNLAYALQYNQDLAVVTNLLPRVDGKIDLAGMLNGFIGDLIPGFTLPPIDLDALASCGSLKEKDSKSALHKTYTTMEADKADAFVTVYYYLYDTINYEGNMETLKKMLGEMDGIDASLMGLIDSLLNEIFTASKEESLCKLGALLASDAWECPDGTGDSNSNSNSGKKTPSTGDYAIPATIFLAVMFSAGAAIVLLRRKKINAQ